VSRPLQLQYYFTGNGTVPNGKVIEPGQRMSVEEYTGLYNWLYSAYSWPNVILPLLGGILSDRLGLRLGNLIFATLVTLGQVVFALGMTLSGTDTNWIVMLTGRVVFGLGGESLSVTMSGLIAKWFGGKELALALGLNLALARLGSVFNDIASPAVAEALSLAGALWVGGLICLVSLICCLVVYFIDKKASVEISKNKRTLRRLEGTSFASSRMGRQSPSLSVSGPETPKLVSRGGKDTGEDGAEWASRPSAVDAESIMPLTAEAEADVDEATDENVDLSVVTRLPLMLWLLTVSCVTTYCAILPFNNIAAQFIVTRWPSVSTNEANYYMAVTYTTAGFVSPFLGAVIDRLGMRGYFCFGSAAVITGVHLLLGYSETNPVIGLVFMGLAYSFYAAALWPSIALVVPDEIVGTAYGLTTAAQNLGLAVVPLVIGDMQNTCPKDYQCVSLTFAIFAGCGIISGILVNIFDARSSMPILNLPEAKIKALKDALKAREEAEEDDDEAAINGDGITPGTPETPLLSDAYPISKGSIAGLSLPPTTTRGN
jgi:MFS family permease